MKGAESQDTLILTASSLKTDFPHNCGKWCVLSRSSSCQEWLRAFL